MPDNLDTKAPLDRTRVNLSQDWEVKYWCKHFVISELKLRQAVEAVGTSVNYISVWLIHNR
ncbi:MAG: DUF3606 domain-containing protein [Deltaproteobacteria bacterium]|nr:DUF3606 domain-containing protein [Deltaproteobacteria bacterium]